MKRILKRAMSMFLAAALLFGAAPLSGLVGLDLPGLFEFKAEAATYSGTCGDNLTWTLDTSTGVLSISGTGAMTDWDFQKSQNTPWYSQLSYIKTIEIDNGVTSIGNSAFYYCYNLTSITIGNGVTTIGNEAFSSCYGLTSVTIPDNVTAIGESAFAGCSGLTNVTIGSGVTSIGEFAFAYCYGLTGITVDADNQYYSSDSNGVLFNKDRTELVQYPTADTRASYTVPDGVTAIDGGAFACCHGITSVTLPDSVKTIGKNAFFECYNLPSVTIPAGMESIGNYAFGYSTKPYFNGTLEQWQAVKTDEYDTITSKVVIICGGTDRPYYIPGTCGTKVNWILYADGELVISGSGAMTNFSADNYTPKNNPWYSMRSNIKSVTIKDGVTTIGNYAFYDCQEITKVTIPDSVTTIGGSAFSYCYGIKELTMPVSAKAANSYTTFNGCHSIEKLTLTPGTGIMQTYTESSSSSSYTYYQYTPWYESRARLNEIVIEDGVTSIGAYAFYYTYGSEIIRIPASLTTIGANAFNNCTDLTDVYYASTQEDWNKISIGVENEPLTSATIHTAAVSGTCGDNLTWALYDTGLLEISGTGAMTDWTAASKTPWYSYRTSVTSVVIREGVTSIGKYAFISCTNLTSATIPESVKLIEMSAFGNSQNLTDVYYASDRDDWAKITVNGSNNALDYAEFHYVFHFVDSGTFDEFFKWELYSNGELTIIGEGGMPNRVSAESYPWYKYKEKITSVIIATDSMVYNEVTRIGDYAFSGYTNLKTVNLTSSVTQIGNFAFANCSALTSITIPDTVTDIGKNAFFKCSALTEITIPDSVKNIDNIAFYGCSGLKELTMPVSAKIYNSINVFYDCANIEKITLTKGNGTMVNYSTVTTVPADTTNYKYTPWYISRSSLKELIIEEGVTSIGSYAFYGCGGITSITIPDGVETIGEYAFCGCSGITSITLPDGLRTVGEYAFYGCSILENTYFTGDVAGWCAISFADSYATPMSYADNVYFGGELVTEVTIPGIVTSIGSYAFYGCSNLTAVYYEGTVEQWKAVTVGEGNDILFELLTDGDSDMPFYSTGKCGDNLQWIMYANGELIISGTGMMYNYFSPAYAPWYNYREKITSVILPEGMTLIGNYAFYNCTVLESVTIPDSVTLIGNYAFYGCTGLKELTMPVSARIMEAQNYTFYNCSNIEKITLTKGNGTSHNYSTSSEVPYAYYGYTPWYISGCSTVVIADGVTSIGDYMFYSCTKLKNVKIADSVTSIGDYAFYNCIGLKELTIPVSAKIYNSSNTFYYCKYLEKVTFTKGDGTAQNYTSTSYSSSTYYQYTPWYISKCATIVIDAGVTSIGYYTFYYCSDIKNVYFTGDITDWCAINFANYYANPMYYADNLYCNGELVTEVYIPETLTSIGTYVFYSCSYITAAYYTGTQEQWKKVTVGTGNDALLKMLVFVSGSDRPYYAPGTCGPDLDWILYTDGELVISGTGDMRNPTNASYVPWYSYCSLITSVTISDSVTSIGDYAFYGCTNLTSVTHPDSITAIGNNAFYGCTGLNAITLSKNIASIGQSAFGGCTNLAVARCEMTYDQWKEVTVQQGNSYLTDAILLGSDSDRLFNAAGNIGENITWYLYEDNELCFVGEGDMASYTAAENVPWYDRRDKIKTVVVSDGITSVGKNAFAECENITNVYIYGYDVSVANGVFDDCYDVNIHCYSGSSAHAYAKRYNLAYTLFDGNTAGFTVMNGMITAYSGTETDIVIPAGITAIGSYAFMNNKTITSIVLPNSVTDIYTGAFAGCDNLERIIIPESVNTIASTAFNGTDVIFACAENSYAHIYATEHGITCEHINPVTGIELTSHSEYISVNGKVQLSVIFAPSNTQNKSVIWTSTDSTIASVDENGLVTGKKAGSVVITATTVEGGYKDFCLVRVVGITGSFAANTVIDAENGYIYGLDAGLDSITDYIELTDNSCSLEYDTLNGELGTGSITNIVRDGEIVDSYTVIIFGDIDGDGWYDANDAFLVNMLNSGLITEEGIGEAAYMAADCNHDGVVNEVDFELLMDASVLLDEVDQSATQAELETNSFYIEYCSLIDQSAGLIIPDADGDGDDGAVDEMTQPEADTLPTTQLDIEAIISYLLELIEKVFTFVISVICI